MMGKGWSNLSPNGSYPINEYRCQFLSRCCYRFSIMDGVAFGKEEKITLTPENEVDIHLLAVESKIKFVIVPVPSYFVIFLSLSDLRLHNNLCTSVQLSR